MDDPWLTVVMPVHRGGDWLDEALASIPSPGEAGAIAVIAAAYRTPCMTHLILKCVNSWLA